jgi:hypothetical protein
VEGDRGTERSRQGRTCNRQSTFTPVSLSLSLTVAVRVCEMHVRRADAHNACLTHARSEARTCTHTCGRRAFERGRRGETRLISPTTARTFLLSLPLSHSHSISLFLFPFLGALTSDPWIRRRIRKPATSGFSDFSLLLLRPLTPVFHCFLTLRACFRLACRHVGISISSKC